jgi:hypothetical protein
MHDNFSSSHSDFKGCNDHNFGEESVPLFTTCARSDCRFAFPTPSFSTIINAKSDVGSWYSMFQKFDEEYPWESKIRKAVWRGTLLEDDPHRVFDNVRWRLLKLVHDQNLDLFDVGLTDVPSSLSQHVHIDTSAVGGLKPRVKSTILHFNVI